MYMQVQWILYVEFVYNIGVSLMVFSGHGHHPSQPPLGHRCLTDWLYPSSSLKQRLLVL